MLTPFIASGSIFLYVFGALTLARRIVGASGSRRGFAKKPSRQRRAEKAASQENIMREQARKIRLPEDSMLG